MSKMNCALKGGFYLHDLLGSLLQSIITIFFIFGPWRVIARLVETSDWDYLALCLADWRSSLSLSLIVASSE